MHINLPAPPLLKVYRDEESSYPEYVNFCMPEADLILKDNRVYSSGSIFFKDYKNLRQINKLTEILYKQKIISSNHFLHTFIHEWIHSFHIDYVYKQLESGNCSKIKTMSDFENVYSK